MNQTALLNGTERNETGNPSSSPSLLSVNIYLLWAIYVFLLVSGNLLNLMVIYVMFRSRKIRSSISSFLIFHLSLTHVIFHIVVPLLRIPGSDHCEVIQVLELASASAIFGSLVAIAWDRSRNVFQPFKSLAPRRVKTFLILVTCIWIYAFMTSTPFIISINIESRKICWRENNGTTCRKYTVCHLTEGWKAQLSKTLLFIMSFVAPFMYMLITYTKIALSLRKRSQRGQIHSAVAKYKAKSIRLMVIAVLVFAVCWGLNFMVDLLTVYGFLNGLSPEGDIYLRFWCLIAQVSSSCLNPVVYAFFSPEFRASCVKYCCCCCSSCPCCRRRYHYIVNRIQPLLRN